MKKNTPKLLAAALLICSPVLSLTPARAQDKSAAESKPPPAATQSPPASAPNGPQKIVKEGVEVEFAVEPAAQAAGAPELVAGRDAVVRFRVRDTATGTPLSSVKPSAWASRRLTPAAPDAAQCREKVQSFVQGSLRARPEVDLNAYYVLALNQEPNISVIDPLLSFGGSKLVTLVFLKSPGEDWALTSDRSKLFVSMPLINQVAVVDTATWKVVAEVSAGMRPTRLALQPDGHYLWVANEGTGGGEPGGVTAVDTAGLKVAASFRTGAGAHNIAFAEDNKFAFVTNRDDGTLSVIDVQKLHKLKDVKTGAKASALAFSPLSKSLYVAGKEPDVVKFPGGQNAPGRAVAYSSRADAFVAAPEAGAVLFANPADRMIYYYMEGMAAPMGNFQNYKREARAVKVIDRSLREESLGVYSTNVRLPKEGTYDVSFLLDSPRIVHCFEATAGPDPDARPEQKAGLRVEYLNRGQALVAGESYKIRFKLTDAATGRPVDGLKDVRGGRTMAGDTEQGGGRRAGRWRMAVWGAAALLLLLPLLAMQPT